jgi:hypothetical protein
VVEQKPAPPPPPRVSEEQERISTEREALRKEREELQQLKDLAARESDLSKKELSNALADVRRMKGELLTAIEDARRVAPRVEPNIPPVTGHEITVGLPEGYGEPPADTYYRRFRCTLPYCASRVFKMAVVPGTEFAVIERVKQAFIKEMNINMNSTPPNGGGTEHQFQISELPDDVIPPIVPTAIPDKTPLPEPAPPVRSKTFGGAGSMKAELSGAK